MPASRRSWIPRPLPALLIGTAVLIAVGVSCCTIYARNRMAAIAYARSHAGEVEFLERSGSRPAWLPDAEWACTVDQVWVADPEVCDLSRLSALHEARGLYLLGCRFAPKGFDAIRRFGRLEQLFVSSTGDVAIEGFSHCPRLRSLACQSVRITDAGLRELAGLPLTELDLTQVPLTDDALRSFTGSGLQTLVLRDTAITDAGLRHLAVLPLRHLDLSGTRVTNTGLEQLRKIPLESLELNRTAVDDAAIPTLKSLRLRRLSLRGTRVTPEGLRILAGTKLMVAVSSPPFTEADAERLEGVRLTLYDGEIQ